MVSSSTGMEGRLSNTRAQASELRKAGELLHPSILLVGCRKQRNKEMPSSGKIWATYYLHVDHMLVLMLVSFLLQMLTPEFSEEKLSKNKRTLEMEMFVTC